MPGRAAAPAAGNPAWILAALVVAGAIVRFATLDLQSFHHDEAVTVVGVLQPSLFDTLDEVAGGERSPPLYYMAAWAWAELFGTGEVGLRSLSALAGTLAIAAGYLAGRELSSPRAGLVLAALIAFNPYLVWYSQEARSYALLILFVTLGLAFFAQANREPQGRPLALWALVSFLAVASHYFAAFVVAPQAAWLLWRWRRGPVRAPMAVAAVGSACLALLPLALAQQGDDRSDRFTDTPLPRRAAEVAVDWSASEQPGLLVGDGRVDAVQIAAGTGGALLFGGAVALLVARGTRRERQSALLAGGIAAAAVLIPLALAVVGLDLFNPRNMMAGLPFALAVMAIGFGARHVARAGLAAAGVACAMFAGVVVAVNSSNWMQRYDWRAAAEAIGEDPAEPRVVQLWANGDDPLILYLDATNFRNREYPNGLRTRELWAVSREVPGPPPAGYRLVERARVPPHFYVYRYEADRRLKLKPDELLGSGLVRERDALLADET